MRIFTPTIELDQKSKKEESLLNNCKNDFQAFDNPALFTTMI
jgi:hypothetical protein